MLRDRNRNKTITSATSIRKVLRVISPKHLEGGEDMQRFSLNTVLLQEIFERAKPLGHHEKAENLNLGFGFLYYGLARSLRPKHLLVIGSGFGFSVVCFALGLKDNGEGMLTFVDPSYSLLKDGPFKTIGGADYWSRPQKVLEHFKRFGLEDIVTHYKLRSDQFFASYKALGLPPIDIAFIDGSHAYDDVKHDFLKTVDHVHKNSYILLHDSNIYVREIIGHAGVKKWIKALKKEKEFFEIINFPFSSGVTLVRILQNKLWRYTKQ